MKRISFYDVGIRRKVYSSNYEIVTKTFYNYKQGHRRRVTFAVAVNPKSGNEMWKILENERA